MTHSRSTEDDQSGSIAGLYCVVGKGVARRFDTPGAVAGFLWGKLLAEYHVYKLVQDLPSDIIEIEAKLKAI